MVDKNTLKQHTHYEYKELPIHNTLTSRTLTFTYLYKLNYKVQLIITNKS